MKQQFIPLSAMKKNTASRNLIKKLLILKKLIVKQAFSKYERKLFICKHLKVETRQ